MDGRGGGNLILRAAALAVTGFSEKTVSPSEKNGFSEITVTVKKHYRFFTVYGSSEDP